MTKPHILIVDDEANLRLTMARILQREGYEVTAAENGAQCQAFLGQHQFDLVYLDIRMPEMNGLDVLKTIHEMHPDLPVILFTSQPDVHSAIQALRSGASDYLLKPLKPAHVIERTKSILAKQASLRRKKVIQAQIESLETELRSLDGVQMEAKPEENSRANNSERYLKRGELTLDLHRYQAAVDGRVVDLPLAAFNYLLVLARHAPNVVDYQTLVAESQGYEASLKEAQELAKWHIHHIRQVVEVDARHPTLVINVRGSGYRLVTD
jgi:DNA-binding response OmpR family regulator